MCLFTLNLQLIQKSVAAASLTSDWDTGTHNFQSKCALRLNSSANLFNFEWTICRCASKSRNVIQKEHECWASPENIVLCTLSQNNTMDLSDSRFVASEMNTKMKHREREKCAMCKWHVFKIPWKTSSFYTKWMNPTKRRWMNGAQKFILFSCFDFINENYVFGNFFFVWILVSCCFSPSNDPIQSMSVSCFFTCWQFNYIEIKSEIEKISVDYLKIRTQNSSRCVFVAHFLEFLISQKASIESKSFVSLLVRSNEDFIL